jgi:hypothetical protein
MFLAANDLWNTLVKSGPTSRDIQYVLYILVNQLSACINLVHILNVRIYVYIYMLIMYGSMKSIMYAFTCTWVRIYVQM